MDAPAPQKVWTYWEGTKTDLIKMCFASWQKHLPDWDICFLDERSALEMDLPRPRRWAELSATARSDSLRLALLWRFGGVWMDASIILTANLDWIRRYDHLQAFWFTLHKNAENWFLYAPRPGSPLIEAWLTLFNSVLDSVPVTAHYVFSLPYAHIHERREYFACYQTFFYLRETQQEFRLAVEQVPCVDAGAYFLNFTRPIHSYKRLVKLTKLNRELYPYLRFPLVYVYLMVGIILVAAGTVFGLLRRKKKKARKRGDSAEQPFSSVAQPLEGL